MEKIKNFFIVLTSIPLAIAAVIVAIIGDSSGVLHDPKDY